MANEPAVASGAASGIDWNLYPTCPACGAFQGYPCFKFGWEDVSTFPVFESEPHEPRRYAATHNPSLQSPKAPIRTGLEGEQGCRHKAHDRGCGLCRLPAAPESAVPAKVGPVSLTVTLNFDLGDPLQKELFCQCLEMFREAGLTQAVPAIAASAPAQAEADAIKAQS